MEWSIQHVARIAGTTSRTLRHYDDVGILTPSRVGANGYRYYDASALVRLQRVLLLRQLGVGLAQIAEVIAREVDEASALRLHCSLLRQERDRLDRQIAAVEHTIEHIANRVDDAAVKGERLMAEKMFDGFDHTRHQDEVEERWGADAYARSDAWWRGKGEAERREWMAEERRLAADWAAAAKDGDVSPGSSEAQDLARRHIGRLAGIPGTPAADPGGDADAYVRGLAEMYVADARFASNYGGVENARFVREALLAYLGEQDPSTS